MTWTYSLTDLANSAKDQVRAMIGDTVASDPQLQDEEIAQFVAGRTTTFGAAADACRALASKFSRSVTQKANGAQVNFTDLAKAYLKMALGFDQQAALAGGAMPYAGGLSIADKQGQESDSDRVPPEYVIGMDDAMLPVPPVGTQSQIFPEDNEP